MENPVANTEEDRFLILTDLPPSPAQIRLATAVIVGSLLIFALIAFGPLKDIYTRRIDAFIPAYVAAMFVCNAVTAILLYAQYAILRSRALLVIAGGYLFAALVLIPFILVYPGVFTPQAGLFGGVQSASWIWCLWHAGFPFFVITYAFLNSKKGRDTQQHPAVTILLSAFLISTAVCLASFYFIAGNSMLPIVASDDRYFTALWPYYIGAPAALANLSALAVLWGRRRSMLDLWLIVVVCLYLIEITLAYYPHPMRFSLGSYATRVIGLFASSLILAVLLYETTSLYSRFVDAIRAKAHERIARLLTGDVVAAAIAHEVKQPLVGMVLNASAGLRFLCRDAPDLDEAKEAFTQIVADGHRAGAVIENIRSLFKTGTSSNSPLDSNDLIMETIASFRSHFNLHRISVRTKLNGDVPSVLGNRVLLQQVLANLITNAIQSMSSVDGSRVLSIEADQDANGVTVSIGDTGCGLQQGEAGRLFNALYTTKIEGMGMGLSICRAIIEAHNGRLWCGPNRPSGSVFYFFMPRPKTGGATP